MLAAIFGCLGLGWLLAFVIFHAVSILWRVFADASVCACWVCVHGYSYLPISDVLLSLALFLCFP
jgi:hypothetical protein